MKYIKKFESSDFLDQKISELSLIVGNVSDIVNNYLDENLSDMDNDYYLQLLVKTTDNNWHTARPSPEYRNFPIYFDPDDLNLDIESQIREGISINKCDRFEFSIHLGFFNLSEEIHSKIVKRIRSEYSNFSIFGNKDWYILLHNRYQKISYEIIISGELK